VSNQSMVISHQDSANAMPSRLLMTDYR